MSADNFLTVERKNDKWIVKSGCASTGKTFDCFDKEFDTRDEAIDYATEIQETEIVEYGISYIEPIEKENK